MNQTKRAELGRIPERGTNDPEEIDQILDAGYLAHVGFCVEGQPFVIPMLYGRDEFRLYLHGSAASRMLKRLETGVAACVTVTLIDGLVLSRPAFDNPMNYRLVVAFGRARNVVDPEQKIRSLRIISEHLIAGRWKDVRGPSERELRATTVLEFSIEEASSKVRNGPPLDDESDCGLPVWAGVLPLETMTRTPIPDDRLIKDVPVPEYVRCYDAQRGGLKSAGSGNAARGKTWRSCGDESRLHQSY